jgi:hypothetical protein
VLVILPFLMNLRGCIEPYLYPPGSGTPAVMQVVRVQQVQPEKKRYILNPNSPIIFEQPDIDESEILKKVEKATELQYEATPDAEAGAMGEGGGKEGGWPEGVPGGELRFLRLQYNNVNWNDGFNDGSNADANFLTELRSRVPFPVRRQGEAIRITDLRRYRPGQAPPFVYFTGESDIRLSQAEREAIRSYVIDGGGMLFADAGSPRWARSFENVMRQIFPDKRLVDVADDDPIFRRPYVFPRGAPPMWHHGGYRAKGIKHQGRWIVFYHPGDLNDAWKTGRSGAEKSQADAAVRLGINVVYYSVTQYLQVNRRHLR